ncbi:adenylate/guanylate cyclase domain-containing protein [Ovoidimarina sediminis]|uniref:adenylate/guanylate cyclase domain-containing protein n=1 Tax=Ovoidimarina sediminis TaxID=3079856 RepID=UPI002914D393|nr:adenylate/guanylate cyclase domain-containing protein [Rhodophyticola sp. MJ-SS7]MDU8942323.1 tetratricopeptide repeat protein [Rhodophyticola sp. MJ-SS7]
MTEPAVHRRLAAIMSTDIAGFSRRMNADEAGTLAAVNRIRSEIFAPKVAAHKGRVVKLMGDGALVEFASVVDAVRCAIAIQRAMAAREKDPQGRPLLQLRIGINLGDIIIEGRDIFGDGVNLAARLQEIASPGGISLSGNTHEHIGSRIDAAFYDDGKHELKNFPKPVRVFRWPEESGSAERTGPATAPLRRPEKPSIAVLPFDNMSGDTDQEYFADGVVEAITATLSRIRSFFVIARNSAFAYKGRHVNVRDIGRELGVKYVLEGSVQRAGNRVRITVQLIETDGGAHLWADKYDGSLDDIFELQDKITAQVAGAIQPSIQFAEIERTRRKPPHDLGAYDYTMRAMPDVWTLEETSATRALKMLDKALEIDPEYPLALALAAWCWAQRSVYNWAEHIGDAKAEALSRAERAAQMSSDDPLILSVLGAVHTFARNFGAARVLLERAIQLDPNSAWALSRLGWLDNYADRPEEAKRHFEHAMRLSPLDPMNFNNLVGIGAAHQVAGDDARAADFYLRALQERPNAHWVHRNLSAALLGAGREEEARASLQTLMDAHPNMTVARFKDAMVFSKQVLDRIGDQLVALGVPEA